ncbi:MAG: Polypeptide-transport-associated domain protein ShlB-type, partial [Rhizorhabdus sp.]|nr:Polypeptide-transport-associated domain protein ShlB-type [Rhizorhabdus sp.]
NGVALRQVRVQGTSLPSSTFDAATQRFIGQAITPETLRELANVVAATYKQSDIAYYSVMIPPQTLDSGVLTVRVVEGFVKTYAMGGVTVSTPTRLIEAHIARIMKSTPLRKSVLERSLSLIRDIPGETVDASVRQLDATGALALDLKVHRKQVEIKLKIDNDGISNITRSFQAQVGVTVNGLVREGDRTTVTGYLPLHPDRYQFYSISHTTPIGTNGLTLTANASTVSTQSNGIKGEATLAGITLNYPLIRSYRKNLSITASLDGINSTNYYLDTAFGDYRSRTVRGGLTWSKATDKQGYAIALVGSQGLDALGARAFTGYSDSTFSKVNLQIVKVNTIGKNLSIKSTTYGQYSRDKLPVTERMALGGRGTGRAFNAGAVTGERGVAGQIELDWKLPRASPLLKGTSLFSFVDGGTTRSLARPAFSLRARNLSLASVGAGIRLVLLQKWRASIEAALPIKRPYPGYSRSARVFVGFGRAI